MNNFKSLALLLVVVLIASTSLILVQSVSAQSTSLSKVTEFSLQYVDHSYDVSSQPTSTKDPYTGEVTTSTIPGYRVENKTIDVSILNPSGASYYNFRWKGHHEDQWHYSPFNSESNSSTAYSLADTFSAPFKASTSTYSVLSLYFIRPNSITPGGEIDVQVQALFGDFRAVPYGHIMPIPGGPTYDFYFEGETSDWSNTQTFQMPQALPSPTVPEFPALALLPLISAATLITTVLLRKKVAGGKHE